MYRAITSKTGKYLYNDVVDRIAGMIRRGDFGIGERLPSERMLAGTFKVSRNCVRQAIQTLAERKILESRLGAGTYVCAREESPLVDSFTLAIRAKENLIREIFQFRLLMEPPMAALAAETVTDEELDRLKIIVCDQERRILAGKEDGDLDSAFHLGIATASKNRIVKRVMDTVNDILNESRSEHMWNEARRKASILGHLKIIDALESRDAKRAFDAMHDHLQSVRRVILAEAEETPGILTK